MNEIYNKIYRNEIVRNWYKTHSFMHTHKAITSIKFDTQLNDVWPLDLVDIEVTRGYLQIIKLHIMVDGK